jgi:hypothetical protein
VGTRDLRTLWCPPISLNQVGHTQRCKAAIFIFLIYFLWWKFVEKSPMKTYMVKRAFIFYILYFYVFIKLVRRCLSKYNSNIGPNWEWVQFSTTYQQFRVGLSSPQRVLSLTERAIPCVHCAWQITIHFDTGWIKWVDETSGTCITLEAILRIAHCLPALQASWFYRSKLWTSSKWDMANRKNDCLKFPWQVHALQLEIP